MAENKSQHYVPKCYLKNFSNDPAGRTINLLNIDRDREVIGAPIKSQCARSYFYGSDLVIEKAVQSFEGAYTNISKKIISGQELSGGQINLLLNYTYFQHMRTMHAVVQHRQTFNNMIDSIFALHPEQKKYYEDKIDLSNLGLIKESLSLYSQTRLYIDDLAFSILDNKSNIEFITSDDPSIITNRFHIQKLKIRNFGLGSAGMLLYMPISERKAVLFYDKYMYSIEKTRNICTILKEDDISYFNELSCLSAGENLYFKNAASADMCREAVKRSSSERTKPYSVVRAAVHVEDNKNGARFRVTDDHEERRGATREIVHLAPQFRAPSGWPRVLKFRVSPRYNATGTGAGWLRIGARSE